MKKKITLLEIFVVLTITSALIAVISPATFGLLKKGSEIAARDEMNALLVLWKTFSRDMGKEYLIPDPSGQAIGLGAGFSPLVVLPSIGGTPNFVQYLDSTSTTGFSNRVLTNEEIGFWKGPYISLDNGKYKISTSDPNMAGILDPWGNPYMHLTVNKDEVLSGENYGWFILSRGPDGAFPNSVVNRIKLLNGTPGILDDIVLIGKKFPAP